MRAIVGRSEERRLLDELLQAVRTNESRTLVVTGEPGAGKTALLEYAVCAAAPFRLARAVGVESEMELPFAALHQLCAPMLEHVDQLPPPQREALGTALGLSCGCAPDRFLVGLAVLGLFCEVAADRPLLCVVDDAQWVDRASARTLAFVAGRLYAESVGMLFATRKPSEELSWLPTMALGGLDRVAARDLLRSVVGGPLDERLRERIIAETGGNPLALLELPRGLSAGQLAGGFGLPGPRSLTGRIEESFAARLAALSEDARRLLLLAAADPVGDPLLLGRACERLGVSASPRDAGPTELLAVGERVAFCHPLARSAVYGSATPKARRAAHLALAEVTDRRADPDRRAWHLAAAAAGPDEDVALELERSAQRARARGGVAAAAAFLRRAVELTLDRSRHAERALTAAQASLSAGAFDEALRLVTIAEGVALDDLQHGQVELLRARVAFASQSGGAAAPLLLRAIERLEPLDAGLARASCLEALSAALFAARLARPGGGVLDVAAVVRATSSPAGAGTAADLLLDGWAAMFADGCAAASPTLQAAVARVAEGTVAADDLHLLWLAVATALVVWDVPRWDELSSRHVELVRDSGTLAELPLALTARSFVHLFRGELDAAGSLVDEIRVAVEATGAGFPSWAALALAALHGDEERAAAMLAAAAAEAHRRGDGMSVTVTAWARAVLYNGLGVYDMALAAAREAVDCPTNSAAPAWAMVELVEAAVRLGEPEAAADARERFAVIAAATGGDWALGVKARSLALSTAGAAAEALYREALERLARCRMRVDLARAHLLYGEWLRREQRRVDARAQLRAAHDHFDAIGMSAFAERAARELLATGATVRKRSVATHDHLTAQERQIAELAREGLSNSEIGARLFVSRRTVESHLGHVFAKLDIRSRRELRRALA